MSSNIKTINKIHSKINFGMTRKLYMVWGSPPVNAVIMTAKALNVELDLQEINFEKREFLEEWFLKLNPSHTVPTLDDNGFVLWDSHAILIYLVEAYGEGSNLDFGEPNEKFKILQILNLDCGTIFRSMSDCLKPLFYEDQTTINSKHLEALKDAYAILERILSSSRFLACDSLSIADISVFSSVVVTNMFLPIEGMNLPNLKNWFSHFQSLDLHKPSEKGIEAIRVSLKTKLETNY